MPASARRESEGAEHDGGDRVPMSIIAYARISTREGRQHLENQRLRLREWAEQQGVEITRIVEDEASANDMRGRKNWRQLLTDIRKGRSRPQQLVAVAQDRFSRSILDTITLLEELGLYNIRVRTCDGRFDQFDPNTATGRMVVALMAGVAELELEHISRRTREGLARARAEGKHIGQQAFVMPQEKLDKLNALPEQMSITKKAKAIGVPYSTFRDWLKKRAASGVARSGLPE